LQHRLSISELTKTVDFHSPAVSLTIMEPASNKRAHSPEKMPSNSSATSKKAKLEHQDCSCGVPHDKALSIEALSNRTPNWTEVLRHVLKIGDGDTVYSV
jgi:hypothetical protein